MWKAVETEAGKGRVAKIKGRRNEKKRRQEENRGRKNKKK